MGTAVAKSTLTQAADGNTDMGKSMMEWVLAAVLLWTLGEMRAMRRRRTAGSRAKNEIDTWEAEGGTTHDYRINVDGDANALQ